MLPREKQKTMTLVGLGAFLIGSLLTLAVGDRFDRLLSITVPPQRG